MIKFVKYKKCFTGKKIYAIILLVGENIIYARVAQLVEHDLAKVGVAGSSPVSRSWKVLKFKAFLFFKN